MRVLGEKSDAFGLAGPSLPVRSVGAPSLEPCEVVEEPHDITCAEVGDIDAPEYGQDVAVELESRLSGCAGRAPALRVSVSDPALEIP